MDQTNVALAAGVKIIDYYEDYFGIDYPLPKQGETTLDLSIKLCCFIDRSMEAYRYLCLFF